MESSRSSIPINRKSREIELHKSQLSSSISSIPFQNTYRKLIRKESKNDLYSFSSLTDVETKTGKKGFLGLSPTGKYYYPIKFLYKN